jgi:exodeoxyribonuclease VII small subunit
MANKQRFEETGKPALSGEPGAADASRKFEEELTDLESIVTQIDSGELSLEDSIDAFERGVTLVRSLNHKLDEVERRVEVLIRGAQGELKSTPYQGEGLPKDGAKENGGAKEDDDIPF